MRISCINGRQCGDGCVQVNLLHWPLSISRIKQINSHGLVICVFCTRQPTLENCPLLSTPLPHLEPAPRNHQHLYFMINWSMDVTRINTGFFNKNSKKNLINKINLIKSKKKKTREVTHHNLKGDTCHNLKVQSLIFYNR